MGMGRGSSWSSLNLETLESDVSSGKSAGAIANSVRQRVAAIKRGDPAPRYVGDKQQDRSFWRRSASSPRRNMGEFQCQIASHCLVPVHEKPSVCCACVRWWSAQCPICRTIRDRRKFAVALASGRRVSRKISTSRRLDLNVISFSDEKIFRVDAAAPGRSFDTFYREKGGDVTTRPISGYTMRKGRVALLRHLIFGPIFTTHDVAWPRSLTRCVAKRLHFVGFGA